MGIETLSIRSLLREPEVGFRRKGLRYLEHEVTLHS